MTFVLAVEQFERGCNDFVPYYHVRRCHGMDAEEAETTTHVVPSLVCATIVVKPHPYHTRRIYLDI